MPEPDFKFVRRLEPYSDGSGHRVTVTVLATDEGPALTIELIHQLSISQWPKLREAINELVQLAGRQ